MRRFKGRKVSLIPASRHLVITDYVTEEKKNSAIRMLKDGVLSEKQISVYSGLPMEVIRKIADEEGMLVK